MSQVNRVTPSAGGGDVEKGQGAEPAGGVANDSASVNSASLLNFGRTPAQVSPCHHYSIPHLSILLYVHIQWKLLYKDDTLNWTTTQNTTLVCISTSEMRTPH